MRSAPIAALLTVACAGEAAGDASAGSSSESGMPIDYASEIQPIWNAACTCHLQGPSGTMIADTLTLNEGMSHAQLLSASTQLQSMPRVAPGDLDGSYVWHKLVGTHLDVGGLTSPMPMIGMLADDELALIESWILAGAPE